MAKFLTASGTSHHLEQLIINATNELVLVTPYLQLSPNFIERLRDADHKGIHIILVYRTNKLNQNEWYLLNELQNIDIFSCENLHAKCYKSDDALIISSMNLYQYSQENNREMSILIKEKTDGEVYQDANREIQSIINSSSSEKSSERMEKDPKPNEDSPIDQIQIDPEYSNMGNFHIPYLYELLSQSYSNVEFEIIEGANSTKLITAENFPSEGIDIEIEDRIFFHFNDQHQRAIWYKKKPLLFDQIPEAKIYVDSNTIKLYWRERTNTVVSEQNLPIKADAYLEIISKVAEILN